MKHSTLISCMAIVIITLTAFSFSNWSGHINTCQKATQAEPPTFFFDLSSGNNNTITKKRLHNAKNISDLIPDARLQENLLKNTLSIRDVIIRLEKDNVHSSLKSQKRNGNALDEKQISLLQSTDYASDLSLEGYIIDNPIIDNSSNGRYFNYGITVIPEQQATYKSGNENLIDFLISHAQPLMDTLESGNLQSGNISFTVTTKGTVANIIMNATCGYPTVDDKFLELLHNLPNGWNAATNEKGEKINQTLTFFFGQGGC